MVLNTKRAQNIISEPVCNVIPGSDLLSHQATLAVPSA